MPPAAGSLVNIDAIVVAPIFSQDGEVTGALYTDRRHEAGNPDVQLIAEIEAKLVELIAQAVTVGLQRAEKDRTILAERGPLRAVLHSRVEPHPSPAPGDARGEGRRDFGGVLRHS